MKPLENDQKLNSDKKLSHIMELLLLFVALIFLTSCSTSDSLLPVPQEMGNMALLRTFGVDLGEDTPWKVTVSTGKQAKGLQGDQEPPTILTGESATLQGACRQLESLTDHTVFYGYVDQLVMSTSLAEEGVEKVLDYFASSSPLSLGTGIWLCEGSAEDLMLATPEEGTTAYLQTFTSDSKLGTAGITRKVGEVFTDIREDNGTFIPVLAINQKGSLEEKGYGILQGDQYQGMLQGEEAQGLTLLLGHDQLLEVEKIQGVYAVNLSQIAITYSSDWDGQKLNSVNLHLKIQGDLLEYPSLPTKEEHEMLTLKTQEQVVDLCKKTIHTLQEWETDVTGLCGQLGLRHPSESVALKAQWEELFPTLPIEISTEIVLGEVNGF